MAAPTPWTPVRTDYDTDPSTESFPADDLLDVRHAHPSVYSHKEESSLSGTSAGRPTRPSLVPEAGPFANDGAQWIDEGITSSPYAREWDEQQMYGDVDPQLDQHSHSFWSSAGLDAMNLQWHPSGEREQASGCSTALTHRGHATGTDQTNVLGLSNAYTASPQLVPDPLPFHTTHRSDSVTWPPATYSAPAPLVRSTTTGALPLWQRRLEARHQALQNQQLFHPSMAGTSGWRDDEVLRSTIAAVRDRHEGPDEHATPSQSHYDLGSYCNLEALHPRPTAARPPPHLQHPESWQSFASTSTLSSSTIQWDSSAAEAPPFLVSSGSQQNSATPDSGPSTRTQSSDASLSTPSSNDVGLPRKPSSLRPRSSEDEAEEQIVYEDGDSSNEDEDDNDDRSNRTAKRNRVNLYRTRNRQPQESYSTNEANHAAGMPAVVRGSIGSSLSSDAIQTETNASGEIRHLCPHPNCGKHFSTSGHARRHSRIHYSLRPFECPHKGCGATFTRRDNCTQHQRARHRSQLVAHRIPKDRSAGHASS